MSTARTARREAAPAKPAPAADHPRPKRLGRRDQYHEEHKAREFAKPRISDESAFKAALEVAALELARAALECNPGEPRAVVREVMDRVTGNLLRSSRPDPSEAESRRRAASMCLQSVITDRTWFLREGEGRRPTEAEERIILDVAWRAARRVMQESSRQAVADDEAGFAAREAAWEARRREKRNAARRARRAKSSG
jgi:hypothetical protein